MACFGDLPAEIIDIVCLQLRNHLETPPTRGNLTARATLASLCQTSRELHGIARPHLYYEVRIGGDGTLVYPFARTILQNQELAGFVHQLEIVEFDTLETSQDPVLDDLCGLSRLELSEETLDHGPTRNLIRFVCDWNAHAVIALDLLLARLHNVVFLRIAPELYNFRYQIREYWEFIARRHQHNARFLPQLKDVTLDSSGIHSGLELDEYAVLLDQTHVERLFIPYSLSLGPRLRGNLSSVRELKVLESSIDRNGLIQLACWFPNLEVLQYEWVHESKWIAGGYATMSEMTVALYPLRRSLRTLIILHPWATDCEEKTSGSLADFDRLRNLMIGFQFLETRRDGREDQARSSHDQSGAQLTILGDLPSSVENLCISDISKSFDQLFRPWVIGLKDRLPNLRSLIVDAPLGLGTSFSEVGVHYQEVNRGSMKSRKGDEGKKWSTALAAAGHSL